MFLLLNGSFGIGKTTVARGLAKAVPRARVHDPERLGFILHHLPPWLIGLKRQPSDYQDIALWRRMTARGAIRVHRRADLVIVPMAFSRLDYFEALAGALAVVAPIEKLCLRLPLPLVHERLAERAQRERREVTPFEREGAQRCCAAHENPAFGTPFDASGPASDIIAAIRERIGC